MNFDLTPEQQMLQDGLRRLLKESATSSGGLAGNTSQSTSGLWDRLADMGVPAALFTEEAGGFGGSGFDILVVFEELGRAGAVEPLLDSCILCGGLAEALGSRQQRPLIGELMAGRILAFAHDEGGRGLGSDVIETRAVHHGGKWTLDGEKPVILAAPLADGLVVSALTRDLDNGSPEVALFILPVDAPGVSLRSYVLNGGGCASDVFLNGVEVDGDCLLGRGHDAISALAKVHARAAAAQCAEAVGLMETVKDLTVEYLRTRRQFGSPIGKFQALQHRLADLLIEIEQARSAAINVCGHLDAEERERDLQVSAAKNLIGRVARLVAEEAVQMHGGIGMTMEYTLGHFVKRLTMVEHRFGDSDWHLERFMLLSAN